MFGLPNPLKIIKGAARLLGGKGGPMAVGVEDQLGNTGEWGILITGVALLLFAGGVVWWILRPIGEILLAIAMKLS